jgi:hypothetical protein
MTPADHSDDLARRADALYAARSALAETERPTRRLGVAEITQFLSDPERSLTQEEQRSLFADPKLRADYRRLKSRLSAVELPALAAASAGDIHTRRFDGGTISVHPSRVPGQTYVILRFGWPASSPRTMLLESAGGELIKRSLPPADVQGEIVMILDEKNTSDQGLLQLICDPTATGSFLV